MTIDKYQHLPVFHFANDLQKRHPKKKLKCIIFGNFGAMNLGDEAILTGQIQELQKIPGIAITVVAKFPEEIKKIHKVQSISIYAWYKIRREIRKSDFVIVGGGGLISRLEQNIKGFIYQLYTIFIFFVLPRIYRKKLYILGIGIYSNANPIILFLTLPFFRNASIVTVRDHHSHTFLKKKNVHATLCKDTSFLMDVLSKERVMQETFFKEHYRRNRMNIGISLMKPSSKKNEKKLIKVITNYVEQNYKKADFWFYAADINNYFFNDIQFADKIIGILKNTFKEDLVIHTIPPSFGPQLFFSSFKLMDFFIAMRFHAAVFAYRNKVNFAGISYDKKCTSFIESVGKTPLQVKNLTWEQIDKNVL